MCCNGLVGFNFEYNKNISNEISKQDTAETIGSFLSKPLILACGQEVKVTPSTSGLTFLTEEKRDSIQRIFFGLLAVALFPLTIIGLIATNFSTTHAATHKAFLKPTIKPISENKAKTEEGKNSPAETTASKVDSLIKPGTNNKKPQVTSTTATTIQQPNKKIDTPIVTELKAPADWVSGIKEKYASGMIATEVHRINDLWCVNLWEKGRTSQEFDKLEEEIKNHNEKAFAFMKEEAAKKGNNSFETPRDILWGLQGKSLDEPIAISESTVKLEEGCFYDFNHKGEVAKSDLNKDFPFKKALKYEKGQLGIFWPKYQGTSFTISGKYLDSSGGGEDQPVYIFKEGDVLVSGDSYKFTVGANGTLLSLQDGKRYPPKFEFAACKQSYDFEDNATKPTNQKQFDPHRSWTRRKDASVITLYEKLKPGFEYPTKCVKKDQQMDLFPKTEKDDKPSRIVVDIEKDPIFKKIVEYFKAEFASNFTSKDSPHLKVLRLALFAAYVANKRKDDYSETHQNYYLGDVLNSGRWRKQDNPLLVKALADQLGIDCALFLVVDKYDGSNKLWNLVYKVREVQTDFGGQPTTQIDTYDYIVDADLMMAFDDAGVPGENIQNRKNAREFYGFGTTLYAE